MIRVNEYGERVPVTITDFDRREGTITIVVQNVGKTTAMICAQRAGDSFLDFVGPLGRPAPLPDEGHVDPIMVDGTGMCGACRVTIDGQLRFACVDGPFFDAHKVDFAELVVRSKTYVDEQETAARLAGAAWAR